MTDTTAAAIHAVQRELAGHRESLHSIDNRLGRLEERLEVTGPEITQRLRRHSDRIRSTADQVRDLREWRARLIGATAAAGALGGGLASVLQMLFGG